MKKSNFDPQLVEIFNKQLKRVTIFVIILFAFLIMRLWFLQVLNGSHYRNKSEDNRIRLQDLPPFRGLILDRNGDTLVKNRPSFDLYAIPEDVDDIDGLFDSLRRHVSIDYEKAAKRMEKASRSYPFKAVCLGMDIDRNELASIETHRFNLPGVVIRVKPRRHYSYGRLGAHLLGYLGEISETQLRSRRYSGSKSGDLVGKAGTELKWQKQLSGTRGGEQVEVDASGRTIGVISRKAAVAGMNICLTIDRELQQTAEEALSGLKGALVAIDPANGQILALASSPSFDPNIFIGGIDREEWQKIVSSKDFPLHNRGLTGQYPPGSIFKIVVALAGLEEGVIDPEEELFCNGNFSLGRGKYHCWKKYGHGKVKLHKAIVESCDVYFYRLGMRLGVDRLARYAKDFGLGRPTGFDPAHEKGGLVPTSEWKLKRMGVPWQGGETVSLSIGQSFLLVTPIQMASMISAVFNGGVLYRPQVTLWAGKDEGHKIYEFSPEVRGKVGVSKANLEIVKKALAGVVNEPHGTGGKARIDGITVAGKTGTAQVVTLEKEKILGEKGEIPSRFRDHGWFVAIAPFESPRIAVAVVVEHGGHGGSAAAPLAKKVIQVYLGKPDKSG